MGDVCYVFNHELVIRVVIRMGVKLLC